MDTLFTYYCLTFQAPDGATHKIEVRASSMASAEWKARYNLTSRGVSNVEDLAIVEVDTYEEWD